MRQFSGLAAAACAATLAIAAPSQATTLTLTFTGVIASGVDGAGIFGTPGASVAGMNFTLVQVLNVTGVFTAPSGNYYGMSGGAVWGDPTLVTHNIFTLGSHTYDPWAATTRGSMIRTNFSGGGVGTIAQLNLAGGLMNEIGISFDYPDPTYYPLNEEDGDIPPQSFSPQSSYVKLGFNPGDGSSILNAVLAPTHWSSTLVVPEPATWALMLIGFGGTGLALRSRRRRLAV